MSGHGEQVEIKVSLAEALYEEVHELNRAATPYFTDALANSVTQREEIKLDDDLYMTAELIPQKNRDTLSGVANRSEGALKDAQRAAQEITPLTPGVAYRLVVYRANGAYVTQNEYVYGNEGAATPLLLDGGTQYTFIAYSVNTTTEPPEVTFTGGTQTLAASNVSITGAEDFMYFRTEMTVSGNSSNLLSVVLRHRMSQITTTINAASIAYPVNAVTATFSRHQPSAVVPLSTGLPSRSGAITTRAVTFSALGTQSVTSMPTIINAATNSLTNFVISSIQIGDITRTNLTPFTNLTVTPGVKYNLVLNITPSDIYLNHAGRPAARINGKIWLRHNLSVGIEHNADNLGSHMVGNYLQWGRSTALANGGTQAGAISGWNTTAAANNAWGVNLGPCPGSSETGDLRVPTLAEAQALLASTIATYIGNWNNSATNYTAATVLTSRRNANVKLTFPTAGNRNFNNGALNARGETGFYWLLGNPSTGRANHFAFHENNAGISNSVNTWAFLVRCVDR